ncbi:PR domain zinc finger protein 5-like [Neocloeon triangulifer]|uniref:PR domain zinc finger protein 5-like n=1 Tax=Neocloeon triangulifer TaxID=2078957 RepID=UPI00286F5EC0|nr:PR domain zinc finger protein 5-like [Neocloeon triangulifer]
MWPKLCRLCERPAANGGFLVAELDKEKFAEWCLNVLGESLAAAVEDTDIVCYFCVWDASLLYEHEASSSKNNSDMCWWPENTRNADKDVNILFESYKAGYVQQCWVSLRKAPDQKKMVVETSPRIRLLKRTKIPCCYCIKLFSKRRTLNNHIKNKHADDAIRCNFSQLCLTYFKTIEERDDHIKQLHFKSKSKIRFECPYCPYSISGFEKKTLHYHVKAKHSDVAMKCQMISCGQYFKTRTDLEHHFESKHKRIEERKKFKCTFCDYKTYTQDQLLCHESKYHQLVITTIQCPKCPEHFSSKKSLKNHINSKHKYRECPSCNLNISFRSFRYHLKKQVCTICQTGIECQEQCRMHRQVCKPLYYNCDVCSEVFQKACFLKYHVNSKHSNAVKGLKYKHLGFKCTICSNYYASKILLNRHKQIIHGFKEKTKFQCAHCFQRFVYKQAMMKHLAHIHNLIEREHICTLCKRKFYVFFDLKEHMSTFHSSKKVKCKICHREIKVSYLKKHMFQIHGVRLQSKVCSDDNE